MKSIKVSDTVHEGLRIMAALERRGLSEIVNEVLEKLVLPYKGIKFAKRTIVKPNK
jgi:predicted CopG family antitoxin